MANAGGAASAPIVAGYILGIYAALGCSWLIRLIAVGL